MVKVINEDEITKNFLSKITYEDLSMIATYLDYKNVSEALSNYSVNHKKMLYIDYVKKVKINKELGLKYSIRKFNNRNIKVLENETEKKKRIIHRTSIMHTGFQEIQRSNLKQIPFNENYFISEDGKLYSLRLRKYLGGSVIKNKLTLARYVNYKIPNLDNGKIVSISAAKLVAFCFTTHEYSDVFTLPQIGYFDKDVENLHFSNLYFKSKDSYNKRTEPLQFSEVNKIRTMIESNIPKKEIAESYGVSTDALRRFTERHEIYSKHNSI